MSKNYWEAAAKHDTIASECSYSDKLEDPQIHLGEDVYNAARAMCDKFPTDEWQMLLVGTYDEQGNAHITDYYIPKQEVGRATVRNDECISAQMCAERSFIGTMHSHNNMGVAFSPTDDEHTNSVPFLRTHIVINNRLQMSGIIRMAMPCGMECSREAIVVIPSHEQVTLKGLENITVVPAMGGWTPRHTSYPSTMREFKSDMLLSPYEHVYED